MRHTPRSEEEAPAPGGVVPAGEYEAVVKRATEKSSAKGNEMIEMILTVYAGKVQTDVFDYLVSTDTCEWKIRHFCESAGIDYYSEDLPAHEFVNRNVRVKLSIKKQESYPDKNNVEDYLPRSAGAKVRPIVVAAAGVADDDIPF